MTSTVLPAYAALDPFPSPNVQSNPPGNYTEQVLASNGDNAIDTVLGKSTGSSRSRWGDGVLLASYDGRPDGGDYLYIPELHRPAAQHRQRKTWGGPTFIARGQMGSPASRNTVSATPATSWIRSAGRYSDLGVLQNQRFAGSVHRQRRFRPRRDGADLPCPPTADSPGPQIRPINHPAGAVQLSGRSGLRRVRRSAGHQYRQAKRQHRRRRPQCRRRGRHVRLVR